MFSRIVSGKTGFKPLDKLVNLDKQLVTGAAKGVGSTVSTLGEIGESAMSKTVGRGVQTITGKKVSSVGHGGTEEVLGKLGVKDAFTPTTGGQKLGFGVEQIGEFFTPGGAVTKGSKAVEAVAGAGKLAKYSKGLGQTAKVVGESLASGGVSLAQTGDVGEAKTSALLGGAGAAVAPGAQKVAKAFKEYMGEKVAPKVINSLVKPISKEFEFGKNAGAGVVKEGIKANTREGLLTKITERKTALGDEIGGLLDKVKTNIDVAPAINKIDDAIKKANKAGDSTLSSRLKEVKQALTSEFDEVTGEVIGKKNMILSPSDARKFKTEIGEAARWTGQAFDNDVNQARVAIYRGINDLIDNVAPGTKALNARFADMLSAERALQRTIDIAERQNIFGLIPAGVGSAVGVGSAIASGDLSPESLIKSAIIGGLATGATKSAASTAAKTKVWAPLAKNLGVSVDKLVNVVTKNNIPLSGTLAKFLDALNQDNEVSQQSPASRQLNAGETVEAEEVKPTQVDIPSLQSQYPTEYREFIQAAIDEGYSQIEVMRLLDDKVKTGSNDPSYQ